MTQFSDRRRRRKPPFNPGRLFANGEQGAWYDPSDFSTLYQDSAGTTPVTALGQPVGLMLDKSGNGNHASQSINTARPTVQARVNLLTRTEEFGTSPWGVFVAGTGSTPSITPNATTAPDGSTTADQVVFNAGAGTTTGDYSLLQQTFSINDLGSYSNSFWVRSDAGGETLVVRSVGGGPYQTASITAEWQRVEWTETASTTGSTGIEFGVRQGLGGIGTINATATVYLWGAQVERGSTATTYQRVTTATDYEDIGLPRYLQFDGVDDAMSTASVDFTASDEMTVCAGVFKASDAGIGVIAELSAATFSTDGAFALLAPSTISTTGSNGVQSRGTLLATTSAVSLAPLTGVFTGLGDISADGLTLRLNGSSVASTAADQGSGNYGNHPLYIGARAGTSLELNGKIYQLIIRGATTSGALLDATERYVARKTGVTL